MGKSIWDVHDATHWLDKISKKNVRVESCAGSQASENRVSAFCVVPLHCCLFKSSVFIVFHGLFIGNPMFPLTNRTAQPYMKGAMGCVFSTVVAINNSTASRVQKAKAARPDDGEHNVGRFLLNLRRKTSEVVHRHDQLLERRV